MTKCATLMSRKPQHCANSLGHDRNGVRLNKYTSLEDLLNSTIRTDNGCFEWQGGKVKGYGRIRFQKKSIGVHRLALIFATNLEPKDLYALHSCDNPACINPEHLRWGTQADNMADSISRNRFSDRSGVNNGRAKLTDSQVSEIRAITGMTLQQIADVYGVSNQLVSRIRANKAWVK